MGAVIETAAHVLFVSLAAFFTVSGVLVAGALAHSHRVQARRRRENELQGRFLRLYGQPEDRYLAAYREPVWLRELRP